jgi:hypothetical protein
MEISPSLVSFCVHRRSKLGYLLFLILQLGAALNLFTLREKNLVKAWCYSCWNYYLWCKFIYSIPWFFFFVFSCNIVLSKIEALFTYWRPCLIQFCTLRRQVCLFNNSHYVFDYFTLLLFCMFFFFFFVFEGGVWRFIACNLSISFMAFNNVLGGIINLI